MVYRLAFGITSDGYLRLTGTTSGLPQVSALYLDDLAYAATVKAAGLAPFQTLRLLEAAREARNHPGIDICCEALELDQKQIDAMSLQSKYKIA